jgi:hypothetical protein
MQRSLILRIMQATCEFDPYFVQKKNIAGTLGLSNIQKCTVALCILAYGIDGDAIDEYCRLRTSTAMEAMKRFVAAIQKVFEYTYLRLSLCEDLQLQMSINEQRGFPDMFGFIFCMHWSWKICPMAWASQFQNKNKERSLILEAIIDQTLWIWHSFFGMLGSNNNINILDRSLIANDMIRGLFHDLSFIMNGKECPCHYLLIDGICLTVSCFVQTIHQLGDVKKAHFSKMQKVVRNDVERAFDVLLQNLLQLWDMDTMRDIIKACMILHNMVIEDERLEDHLKPLFKLEHQ